MIAQLEQMLPTALTMMSPALTERTDHITTQQCSSCLMPQLHCVCCCDYLKVLIRRDLRFYAMAFKQLGFMAVNGSALATGSANLDWQACLCLKLDDGDEACLAVDETVILLTLSLHRY